MHHFVMLKFTSLIYSLVNAALGRQMYCCLHGELKESVNIDVVHRPFAEART